MSPLILAEVIAADGDVRGLMGVAAALVADSFHDLAEAVRDYAEALDISCIPAEDRRFCPGRVTARIRGDLLSLAPLAASDDVPPALRRRWAPASQRVWVLARCGAASVMVGMLVAADRTGG